MEGLTDRRPWSSDPQVIVYCRQCGRTLAQVVWHEGILYWHAEGWRLMPKEVRDDRGEDQRGTLSTWTTVEFEKARGEWGFAVLCPKHPVPAEEFGPLKAAVLRASADKRPKRRVPCPTTL